MIRSWVVELRFDGRLHRPALFAIRRELRHLHPVLFDSHDSVGLRFDVQATNRAEAVAYVESRIRALHQVSAGGVPYSLDAATRNCAE